MQASASDLIAALWKDSPLFLTLEEFTRGLEGWQLDPIPGPQGVAGADGAPGPQGIQGEVGEVSLPNAFAIGAYAMAYVLDDVEQGADVDASTTNIYWTGFFTPDDVEETRLTGVWRNMGPYIPAENSALFMRVA